MHRVTRNTTGICRTVCVHFDGVQFASNALFLFSRDVRACAYAYRLREIASTPWVAISRLLTGIGIAVGCMHEANEPSIRLYNSIC